MFYVKIIELYCYNENDPHNIEVIMLVGMKDAT